MTRPTIVERLTLQSCSAAALTNSTTPPPSINSVGTGCDWISSSWSKLGMLDVSLGSGTINCAIEASKWRRYWVWVAAAGSIATRKAAQAQDRSHFGVPSGFDRFCPGPRRQVLEYSHMPAPCLLALNKIASNLDRAINGS